MKIRKMLSAFLISVCLVCAASCFAKTDEKETTKTEQESSEEETTEKETTAVSVSDTEEETAVTTEAPADTTAPMWLEAPDSVTVEQGSDFDINDYISYIDDYDSVVDIEVSGEVDTSAVSDYPISIVLTDDAGNTTSKDMTVKVIEPLPPPDETDDGPGYEIDYYDYADLISKYDDGKVMFGIDISKYQGDVDFEKVKAAGCDFVIMRAMVYYKGELITDDKFSQNIKNAKAAGLKVGVYIYTFANTEELVREQTDALCELLDGEQLDFPVVFDWERFSCFQQYNLSMADLRNLYQVFKDELAEYGYDAMLYSSKYYLETIWKPEGETVWLAHYIGSNDYKSSYEGDYVMWQISCFGKIDGIDGPVDLDIYYGG